MSVVARRQSKSDSETSSTEDHIGNSSQGSLDWCSSVGPLNWADEVEAELFADEIQGLLSETPNTPQSPPQTPEAQKTRKTGKKDTSPGKSNAGTPKTPYKSGHSWADGCAGVVLQLLLDNGISRTSVNLGWEALQRMWNVGPSNLDTAVLSCLSNKPLRAQEHILLSFAAIDLSNVKNLSAYLNCLVKEHDTTRQVCLYFLAGLCSEEIGCTWVHPVNSKGWDTLRDTWQVTYQDLDYTVLNFLCKKSNEEQDHILLSLAAMDLRGINNLSAYLSSMIQKHGSFYPYAGGRRFESRRLQYGRHNGVLEAGVSPDQLQNQDGGARHAPTPGGSSPFYSPAYMPPPQHHPHACMGPRCGTPYGPPYMMSPYDDYTGVDRNMGSPLY